MKTVRSQRCKDTPKQMSKEESLELEHILFDHQKGLSTHTMVVEKQPMKSKAHIGYIEFKRVCQQHFHGLSLPTHIGLLGL